MAKTLPEDPRIADLKNLQNSAGWEVIHSDLAEKLDSIENNILNNVVEDFNEVKFTQWDLEKQKRAFLKMLLEYPETLIKQFTPIEDPDEALDAELMAKATQNMEEIG